jgi:hypothetical protein
MLVPDEIGAEYFWQLGNTPSGKRHVCGPQRSRDSLSSGYNGCLNRCRMDSDPKYRAGAGTKKAGILDSGPLLHEMVAGSDLN